MSIKGDLIAVGIAGAVLFAAAWYAKKKLGDAAAVAGEVAGEVWDYSKSAATAAGDSVIARPAFAVGDALGVPRTNETACEKAIREGSKWDASFACDASTFIKYVWE